MKTTLNRIKTLFQGSATLSYLKKVEIVSPRLLPDTSLTLLPYVGIAPLGTTESWVAQKKESRHRVEIYVVTKTELFEASIVGDTVRKGSLEVVEDVSSVIRAHRLPDTGTNYYLSKPIEITNITYDTPGYGDNFFLFVATLTLECPELFEITLP